MKIPSDIECYQMMASMAMLDNIAAHSIRVCQVADLITECLNGKGHKIDPGLIKAAALLHDITKTRSLKTSENHASTGADYLREQGYPLVADVVGQHVRLDGFQAGGVPTAAEIVNYADKRVQHDRVVSLEARMVDLMARYSGSTELGSWLDIMRKEARSIEVKLFADLPFSAAELIDHLDSEDFFEALEAYRKRNSNRTGSPT